MRDLSELSEWAWDHIDWIVAGIMISIFGIGIIYMVFFTPNIVNQCFDLIDKKEIYGTWNQTEKDYMYANCTKYL